MHITTSSGHDYFYLKQTNEIVDSKSDDDLFAWEFEPLSYFTALPNVDTFIISITEQCNLRCSYCCYSGSYKNNASSTDIIEATSPILVNKAGNNLTMINGSKTQVNYNILNESTWTTKTTNLVQASSFDSIEIVTDFPTTMKQNVLYMRIEGV